MSGPETSASQSPSQASPSPRSPSFPKVPPSPTTATGLPDPPSSPKSTSGTHISQVQPHASFFRVSRPNESASAASRPRPTSFASASSAVHNRLIDAIHLTPLSRQLSLTSASDGSSIAARRAPGIKHSREPLLPIGVAPRNTAELPSTEPATPTTSTGRVRGSLDKIFKRGMGADSPPASPRRPSVHNKSPLQAQFAAADIELPHSPPPVNDGYFAGQTPPPQSQPRPQHRTPTLSTKRSMDFAAHPPPGSKPFIPYVSPKTGRPQRNYEDYPSQNFFFMRGHLLTGGDTLIPFIASLVLVLGISGTWFATTCVWWWHDESPAVAIVGAYMCLVTISSMLATALRDPGILPRNLDLDPPYPATSPSDGSPAQPYPRDLRIGENVVRVKYCVTCKTYRPPRSSHCKSCDNCIDSCDHHCQWVNNCVGRRNYTSFITFLLASSMTLVLAVVTAALHLYILTRREHVSFRGALSLAPGSAVVFALGIVVIWPLFALMGYHVRLLLLNVTTIEQVRNKVHATIIPGPTPPNPFSLGRWHRNVAYLLCRPAGYSWIEPAGVKMKDQREINPGAYDSDGET